MAKTKPGAKGGIVVLERSPSHLLHKVLQRALDIYGEEFGPGSITQRQFAVMAAAAEREGATQADLVRITGIDRSTLADMATRMIAKGLLERERSALDARANAVRLTQAGHAALAEAGPKMAAADARVLKLIAGARRRDAFVDLLRELAQTGDAEPQAVAPVKVEKPPKAGKPEKPAKAPKAEKPAKPPKAHKPDKPAKAEKPEKAGKDKSAKKAKKKAG